MDVIKLAKEAGWDDRLGFSGVEMLDFFERFAALVRAKREWVDLTDDEIGDAWEQCGGTLRVFWDIASSAFKEKNK
jgi:phosphoglycerol transferase MdoB-like AlkP superfamily enzyme